MINLLEIIINILSKYFTLWIHSYISTIKVNTISSIISIYEMIELFSYHLYQLLDKYNILLNNNLYIHLLILPFLQYHNDYLIYEKKNLFSLLPSTLFDLNYNKIIENINNTYNLLIHSISESLKKNLIFLNMCQIDSFINCISDYLNEFINKLNEIIKQLRENTLNNKYENNENEDNQWTNYEQIFQLLHLCRKLKQKFMKLDSNLISSLIAIVDKVEINTNINTNTNSNSSIKHTTQLSFHHAIFNTYIKSNETIIKSMKNFLQIYSNNHHHHHNVSSHMSSSNNNHNISSSTNISSPSTNNLSSGLTRNVSDGTSSSTSHVSSPKLIPHLFPSFFTNFDIVFTNYHQFIHDLLYEPFQYQLINFVQMKVWNEKSKSIFSSVLNLPTFR
jgi:hypothetical protein